MKLIKEKYAVKIGNKYIEEMDRDFDGKFCYALTDSIIDAKYYAPEYRATIRRRLNKLNIKFKFIKVEGI